MHKKVVKSWVFWGLLISISFIVTFSIQAENSQQAMVGVYQNEDYRSALHLAEDGTFNFRINFGEGWEVVKGEWFTFEMDTEEIGLCAVVTSQHIGVVVAEQYVFTCDTEQQDRLFLTDGWVGVMQVETLFIRVDVRKRAG